MPKLVTYRCPDCAGEFDFLHHPSNEPPPEHCELCNAYMGDEPAPIPVLKLNIHSDKTKRGDHVYKQMSDGSHLRAQAAAEMSGADVSDMTAMKVTDLKDARHEGEMAAPSITQAQKNLSYTVAGRAVGPELQSPQAAAFVESTTSGPSALSTRSMIDNLQGSGRHNNNVHRLTARGQLAKHQA